jgi:hypothetical protein
MWTLTRLWGAHHRHTTTKKTTAAKICMLSCLHSPIPHHPMVALSQHIITVIIAIIIIIIIIIKIGREMGETAPIRWIYPCWRLCWKPCEGRG